MSKIAKEEIDRLKKLIEEKEKEIQLLKESSVNKTKLTEFVLEEIKKTNLDLTKSKSEAPVLYHFKLGEKFVLEDVLMQFC